MSRGAAGAGGRQPLPIDPLLPEIVARLREKSALVLEAPPGAGKTTRVPLALLEAGFGEAGEILVLQPRRLPTRLAAARVAEELGQALGERVGYSVRFEEKVGPRTRLRFLTEGILTRRLVSDPLLRGVAAVVIDEFHERHLAGDLALALLRRLQRGARPDLKLVVMSATLDAAPVADFLGAERLVAEGRRFELQLEHQERPDDRPLAQQVAGAVKRLVADGLDGHVLVFLPGAAEIRRAAEALAPLAEAQDLLLLPLHGELPPAEQDRAVQPSGRRKVILSTNVAETSVTIDDVVAVVDSGLARMASHSPWSGLPVLRVGKISQAAATQRAGRAGRTRAGKAIRLYGRHDFEGRPAHENPEIRRLDLAETWLALLAAGVSDPRSFEWFEAPPAAAVETTEALLSRLGAVDAQGKLGEEGRRLASFPVHPRLGKWILEGERLDVGADACRMAAVASERDIRAREPGGAVSAASDLIELAELLRRAEEAGLRGQRLRSLGLDPRAAEAAMQAARQLRRLLRGKEARLGHAEREAALLQVVLRGFPDRVAKRRSPGGRELVLSGGGSARLAEQSVVHEGEFLIAVAVEERTEARGGSAALVRLASRIEPEWLLDLEGAALGEQDELVWNAEAQRVERWSRILYGAIALEESRGPAAPSEDVSIFLAEQVLAAGLERFLPDGRWASWRSKLDLAAKHFPEAGFPEVDAAWLREGIAAACAGLRSFAELDGPSILLHLESSLGADARRILSRELPERIALPGGRKVMIHYEADRPPWIESRLQDFFGMQEGPRILGGRLPLTIHLLAPNQRAVQVTQDLAGFWQRHYPALRRELGRRYPRHAWPEDGTTATPPPPRPPRRG